MTMTMDSSSERRRSSSSKRPLSKSQSSPKSVVQDEITMGNSSSSKQIPNNPSRGGGGRHRRSSTSSASVKSEKDRRKLRRAKSEDCPFGKPPGHNATIPPARSKTLEYSPSKKSSKTLETSLQGLNSSVTLVDDNAGSRLQAEEDGSVSITEMSHSVQSLNSKAVDLECANTNTNTQNPLTTNNDSDRVGIQLPSHLNNNPQQLPSLQSHLGGDDKRPERRMSSHSRNSRRSRSRDRRVSSASRSSRSGSVASRKSQALRKKDSSRSMSRSQSRRRGESKRESSSRSLKRKESSRRNMKDGSMRDKSMKDKSIKDRSMKDGSSDSNNTARSSSKKSPSRRSHHDHQTTTRNRSRSGHRSSKPRSKSRDRGDRGSDQPKLPPRQKSGTSTTGDDYTNYTSSPRRSSRSSKRRGSTTSTRQKSPSHNKPSSSSRSPSRHAVPAPPNESHLSRSQTTEPGEATSERRVPPRSVSTNSASVRSHTRHVPRRTPSRKESGRGSSRDLTSRASTRRSSRLMDDRSDPIHKHSSSLTATSSGKFPRNTSRADSMSKSEVVRSARRGTLMSDASNPENATASYATRSSTRRRRSISRRNTTTGGSPPRTRLSPERGGSGAPPLVRQSTAPTPAVPPPTELDHSLNHLLSAYNKQGDNDKDGSIRDLGSLSTGVNAVSSRNGNDSVSTHNDSIMEHSTSSVQHNNNGMDDSVANHHHHDATNKGEKKKKKSLARRVITKTLGRGKKSKSKNEEEKDEAKEFEEKLMAALTRPAEKPNHHIPQDSFNSTTGAAILDEAMVAGMDESNSNNPARTRGILGRVRVRRRVSLKSGKRPAAAAAPMEDDSESLLAEEDEEEETMDLSRRDHDVDKKEEEEEEVTEHEDEEEELTEREEEEEVTESEREDDQMVPTASTSTRAEEKARRKAQKGARKAAERERKAAEKAEREARRAAEREQEEARRAERAAEKAEKEARKAAEKAAKKAEKEQERLRKKEKEQQQVPEYAVTPMPKKARLPSLASRLTGVGRKKNPNKGMERLHDSFTSCNISVGTVDKAIKATTETMHLALQEFGLEGEEDAIIMNPEEMDSELALDGDGILDNSNFQLNMMQSFAQLDFCGLGVMDDSIYDNDDDPLVGMKKHQVMTNACTADADKPLQLVVRHNKGNQKSSSTEEKDATPPRSPNKRTRGRRNKAKLSRAQTHDGSNGEPFDWQKHADRRRRSKSLTSLQRAAKDTLAKKKHIPKNPPRGGDAKQHHLKSAASMDDSDGSLDASVLSESMPGDDPHSLARVAQSLPAVLHTSSNASYRYSGNASTPQVEVQ